MRDLAVEQQASLTAGATMWTTVAIPDSGIPSVRMADGPMGIAGARVDERDVSVLTPAPVSLGASWDGELVERVGALVGGEAARWGVDLILAPNVNLARSPLAGRAFEYFSEDPFLAGSLGSAWATGVQTMGVGSVAKHLVCNDSETARNSMNAVVDERTLREVYLLPFEMLASIDCAGMLTAYNRVNGAWCSEAGDVIGKIAKQDWGYGGVFMSDWFGTQSTLGAINGGLDLEMPGPARHLGAKVAAAFAAEKVSGSRLFDASERVARIARRYSGKKRKPFSDDYAQDLLTEAAAAGFTLVRNETKLLPLVPGKDAVIAIIGPTAAAPCFQGGTFAKIALKPDAILPIEAIQERYGSHCQLIYEPGVDPQPRLPGMKVAPAHDVGDGCVAGMTVQYFASQRADEAPVRSETRDTNSLTWFFGVHDEGAFQHPAMTRASGILTPTESGPHRFYIGGTGSVSLSIDGLEVLRHDEEVAASDVMGRLKSGDAETVDVDLAAGQPVRVTAELRYAPARVQGLWYGVRSPGSADELMDRAVAAASKADAVILMVGETSDASVESKDRPDTRLPPEQIRLIERITAANPRTAIIANVGHAFDTSWEGRAPALLLTWYPGQEFGRAIAEVLAGDREPGGRMPMTIAMNDEDYPALSLQPEPNGDLVYREGTGIGYRGLASAGIRARHAFGSGFGYATFTIGEPRVASKLAGGLEIGVNLRNISERAGSEVVQVYRVEPELTLVGFAKTWIEAGADTELTICIDRRRLQSWNGTWQDVGETVELRVGRASDQLSYSIMASLSSDSHNQAPFAQEVS
jgi:beta-glucosidase